MNEPDVLIEFENPKRKNRYTKLGFLFFFLTVLLLLYVFISIPNSVTASEPFPHVSYAVIIVMWLCCVTGVTSGILSFIKREQPAYLKVLAFILNVLVFLILVALVVFAKVMDASAR